MRTVDAQAKAVAVEDICIVSECLRTFPLDIIDLLSAGISFSFLICILFTFASQKDDL